MDLEALPRLWLAGPGFNPQTSGGPIRSFTEVSGTRQSPRGLPGGGQPIGLGETQLAPAEEITRISRGLARSALGMLTSRTPCSYRASIFSGSTVLGRTKVRSKVP